MDSKMFRILDKYRDNDDPELRDFEGRSLATFSKDELLKVLEDRQIDGLALCRIGAINPLPEFLCRLAHYAIGLDDKDSTPGTSKEDGPSAPKKAKKSSAEEVTMRALVEKVENLEKELKEKKAADEQSEFEKSKKEVREEAQKAEVNVDILHEKLVTLENVARRANHPEKDKLALVLARFHFHKSNPFFVARLILKLISNKDEESVFMKEQKLMKQLGIEYKGGKGSVQNLNREGNGELKAIANFYPGGWGYGFYPQGPFAPAHLFPQHGINPTASAWQPFPPASRSQTVSRPRGRYNGVVKECFRCRKTTHLVKDCPLN